MIQPGAAELVVRDAEGERMSFRRSYDHFRSRA
jgi:hypothetical protein